jgi:hypothetical protein
MTVHDSAEFKALQDSVEQCRIVQGNEDIAGVQISAG